METFTQAVLLWLATTVLSFIAYILYMTWNFGTFKKMGVEGPPFSAIVELGNMGFSKVDVMLMKRYGKVWGVQEGRDSNLFIADEEMLKELLVKKFSDFPNRRKIKGVNRYLDHGLGFLDGERWKSVRNMMTPTFSAGKLKKMEPLIKEASEVLVENLRNKCSESGQVNVKGVFGSYTVDVISSTAFGLKIDSQKNPNDPFVRNASKIVDFKDFEKPIFLIAFLAPFLLKPLNILFDISIFDKDPQEFFRNVVVREINKRREQREDYVDFMQLMIQVHDENTDPNERKGMSFQEIIGNSILFFFAGYETTATTLSTLSYNLALYPDAQENVVEEIERELGDDLPDYDNINKLAYLDMCVNETLRLYPPVTRVDRICERDNDLCGLRIPKGMIVTVPIWAIHHSPDIWPDPEVFDPERFSRENKRKISAFHFLPFGYGQRNCIGMRLALLELKIAFAYVIRKFKFSVGDKTEIPPKIGKTGLLAIDSVWLNVETR